MDVTNGKIKVLYAGPKANSAITNSANYLVLSPVSNVGSIGWTCTRHAGPEIPADHPSQVVLHRTMHWDAK